MFIVRFQYMRLVAMNLSPGTKVWGPLPLTLLSNHLLLHMSVSHVWTQHLPLNLVELILSQMISARLNLLLSSAFESSGIAHSLRSLLSQHGFLILPPHLSAQNVLAHPVSQAGAGCPGIPPCMARSKVCQCICF